MKYWPWYVALGLVTFILVAGGVVGSRLSEQTLAFMAGVIFGGIAALPIGAVIGWAVRSPRQTDRAYTQPQPTVIMTPPAYPGSGSDDVSGLAASRVGRAKCAP